jgi:hypothetical protein
LKPETGEGYVIKKQGASKNDPKFVHRNRQNVAMQYEEINSGTDNLLLAGKVFRQNMSTVKV